MPLIDLSEVIFYRPDGRTTVVCRKCMTPEEMSTLSANEFVLEHDLDDDTLAFCDRCGENVLNCQ